MDCRAQVRINRHHVPIAGIAGIEFGLKRQQGDALVLDLRAMFGKERRRNDAGIEARAFIDEIGILIPIPCILARDWSN